MKLRPTKEWTRTEDYMLVRLVLKFGWGENTAIMMSPVWSLLCAEKEKETYKTVENAFEDWSTT
jgi:hypothetical protein